jgi:L-rhamnose mutarotase
MSGRHVLTMNLKGDPGIVETYTRLHRDVWPEVQASLRQVGVERMDIYLLGRRLVMVVEMRDGLDYHTAFAAHASSSQRVAEWERLMKSLQEPAAEARANEWWAGRHGAGLSSESGCSGGAGHCPRRRSVAHVLSQG